MSNPIASNGLTPAEEAQLNELLIKSRGDSDESSWGHNKDTRSGAVRRQISTAEFDMKFLIRTFGPHVVCAGGAPRNWYFNKEARDFDYYILTPLVLHNGKANVEEALKGMLLELTGHNDFEDIRGSDGAAGSYSDPHIDFVLRASWDGQERDFIFLKWDVKAVIDGSGTQGVLPFAKFVVDNFGCTISEAALCPVWDSKGWGSSSHHFEFYRSDRFNKSVKTKTIQLRATSEKYAMKLRSYFKGWTIKKGNLECRF